MRIIVESGATKSDWRLFDEKGRESGQFLHEGTNVSSMSLESVRLTLADGISKASSKGWFTMSSLKSFELYTAGIVTEAIRAEIVLLIRSLVEVENVDVNDDLVGAARALYGSEPGVVAILGTGSNSCYYDGTSVHRKVYSGGFILGDEGGAAALGRMFLSDYIKNLIPSDVAADFAASFDVSYESIVSNVYRGDAPSRYLGSFAPFIVSHCDNDHVRELVEKNFRNFIERSLMRYDGVGKDCVVGVVGGFGYACRDIFSRLASEYGIRITEFLPAPIEGLGRR